ncbi:hypothetical protein NKJ36_04600 [Mesorhizobium sp. M0142]|uniref:hypothetical protein n=1 Tax=unclassified Mesorhizobium TaxID=325217 RepID=UPI003334B569
MYTFFNFMMKTLVAKAERSRFPRFFVVVCYLLSISLAVGLTYVKQHQPGSGQEIISQDVAR